MAKRETKTVETIFEEIDDLIEKLANADISLEQSFQYYETGMKLIKSCSDKIDKVEKKIMVLAEDGGDHEQDDTGI